ncbi:hypothetical protein [Tissierella creatinophila]|uniref:ABC-2 family transporter protein n=1 Tax=Tissierella creatinophila DSM 6911 TaxID=1123403 RepID=A0A1U7M786_TISCR|nr:hypothetical protein [Tissierella creatinophila]OLS03151.1 hypothetical protein TICRE_08520 [Tissierella creatinophila DSM 6911]
MEAIKKSIKYQFIESKKFILGFWSTVIVVDIFFYILNDLSSVNNSINFNIGFSLGNTEGIDSLSIVGVNLMIIFVALLVYNYERNYESFPLSLSFSMTRKDYFLSFLIDNIVISFIFASIQGVLLKIDPSIVKLVGKEPLYDFINFNLKTDNVLFIIFTLFILFLTFTCVFNLLASLNYKFGYKLWVVIIGINIIISTFNIKTFDKILLSIGNTIATRFGIFEIVVILASVVALYSLNYFVTIKTDIKRKTI